MSIINRLKSLFKGDMDKEESDINNDVSNTSNDVEVTSSKMEETVAPVKEDSEKDLTFKKDIEIVEDSSEEEAETTEEEVAEEVAEEEVAEEVGDEETTVEDVVEEVEENSNKNIKRDTMTLLTDKELLNDSNRDPDFTAEFIDAGIETVKHCFQCGTCSGGCPSGRRTPYKVRQIVRKCLLGLKEEVITDDALWMCTTCYTCQERCLRSVKIVEIIKKARNVAAHAGYMAKAHKMTGVFVLNTGHAVPINDEVKALRAKIGLPEVPPTTHAFPEALTEVQKLCKITAFDELIGYDEATGGLKE
ncbi:MAG: CoB--CoM heterodisulfide reductase subunit C [Methanobrevibacter sp.]|uniref:CoB--CoM heterodisulfide reductase subunit C n=1 Tax=Methanobrevibacter sp. TaxID=66852 RepID=UPI003F0B4F6B